MQEYFGLIGSNPSCCKSLFGSYLRNTPLYNEFSPFILAPGLLLYRTRPPEVTEENWFLIKLLHTRVQKLSHNVVHNENWHHQMALVSLFSFFSLDVMHFFWHLHIWLQFFCWILSIWREELSYNQIYVYISKNYSAIAFCKVFFSNCVRISRCETLPLLWTFIWAVWSEVLSSEFGSGQGNNSSNVRGDLLLLTLFRIGNKISSVLLRWEGLDFKQNMEAILTTWKAVKWKTVYY